MIRAAFFDIDGTLVPFGHSEMPDDTRDALCRLHDSGIAVVLATGRREAYISHATSTLAAPPDALVMANGQICKVGRDYVRIRAIDEYDVRAGLAFLAERRIYTMVGEFNRNISLNRKADCVRVRWDASEFLPPYDIGRISKHPVIEVMPSIFEEDVEVQRELMALMPNCQAERWNEQGIDIIARGGGKGVGVHAVARALGLSRDELVAFGDAQNDISMFEACGTSVAMGNASPECKAAATFVTSRCDVGGIAQALEKLGLI